ncbi:MAG: hypothetical protein KKB20_07495 [Proteobacteria bacterium]|nr:hypothetical protein [Pseudomonadota bacterium]
MEFMEKARIRIDHWLRHNLDHLKEYEVFAAELEEAGKADSARHIREMVDLMARSVQCLRRAEEAL